MLTMTMRRHSGRPLGCWHSCILLLALSFLWISQVQADDDDDDDDDDNRGHEVGLHIVGRGGKLTLHDDALGVGDPHSVTLRLAQVQEIALDGTTVLREFDTTSPSQKFLTVSETEDDTTWGVFAEKVVVSSDLTTGNRDSPTVIGQLEMALYLFQANGTVTGAFLDPPEDVPWPVQANDVLVQATIRNYAFCSDTTAANDPTCQGQTASGLQLALAAGLRRNGNTTLELDTNPSGGSSNHALWTLKASRGLTMALARGVLSDNVWQVQPEGYPQLLDDPASLFFPNGGGNNPATGNGNRNGNAQRNLVPDVVLLRWPTFASAASHAAILNYHVEIPTASGLPAVGDDDDDEDDDDDDSGDDDDDDEQCAPPGRAQANAVQGQGRGQGQGQQRVLQGNGANGNRLDDCRPNRNVRHDTEVRIAGRSGAFTLYDTALGATADPNKVLVKVDAVHEYDVNGQTKLKAWESMANQDFDIEEQTDEGFTVSGIPALCTVFSSILTQRGNDQTETDVGTIVIQTCIFKGNGTVVQEGNPEVWNINENDVKFNIAVRDWQFDAEGEWIDVVMLVQGRRDRWRRVTDQQLGLGGNVSVFLSNQVLVDNTTWVAMADGYPLLEGVGNSGNSNRQSLTARFARFASSAVYDPVVDFSRGLANNTIEAFNDLTGDGGTTSSASTIARGATWLWTLPWALVGCYCCWLRN